MNPILATLWLLGATLLVLAAKSEPTLGQCYSCGEVLYARPYVPVCCPGCRAVNWFWL